jgi:NAD-dependent SIR2 family protein deacetylase
VTATADAIGRAADLIASAKALVLATGAGMGVDSGLPDYRGPEGFWHAYPPYRALGLRFEELANPRWFKDDPSLAWGFYGHRLSLYRQVTPHDGYQAFLRLAERCQRGAFAFTSNVDGHCQRAGFDEEHVVEIHGSFAGLQCSKNCSKNAACGLWSAASTSVIVDDHGRALAPLPACPHCGAIARPNILMFGDWQFLDERTSAQLDRFHRWLDRVDASDVCVVECGAGTAVATVRHFSEQLVERGGSLVRINLREAQVPTRGRVVGIPLGARAALVDLAERVAP